MDLIKTLPLSFQMLKRDKLNLLLALIPVVLGFLLYGFLGSWAYETLMSSGRSIIDEYISNGTLGAVVYYFLLTIMTILLFFLINWTFVLVISLLASPFNDLLSSRIEKLLRNEELPNTGQAMKSLMAKLLFTIKTEILKVSLILFLSLTAFALSYIPVLAPFGVLVTMLLLAIEFLDYSWSRHEMSFKECLRDTRRNIFPYTLSGSLFFILVSTPFLNIFVPSLATSFFTILWFKRNESSN